MNCKQERITITTNQRIEQSQNHRSVKSLPVVRNKEPEEPTSQSLAAVVRKKEPEKLAITETKAMHYLLQCKTTKGHLAK